MSLCRNKKVNVTYRISITVGWALPTKKGKQCDMVGNAHPTVILKKLEPGNAGEMFKGVFLLNTPLKYLLNLPSPEASYRDFYSLPDNLSPVPTGGGRLAVIDVACR